MFKQCPLGFLLHGSRSGLQRPAAEEWAATANYATDPAHGLGWHASIGPHRVAVHISPHLWGWNAREHSDEWIAVEFAQPTVDDEIDDSQLAAFAWYVEREVLPVWPNIPRVVVCHSELEAGIRDGKSDAFPIGPKAEAFKTRVLAVLP